jgi:hypothetical protein
MVVNNTALVTIFPLVTQDGLEGKELSEHFFLHKISPSVYSNGSDVLGAAAIHGRLQGISRK